MSRFVLAFVAVLLLALPTFAAELPPEAASQDLERLRAAGWEEVSPNLFQRSSPDSLETIAYGNAGYRYELGLLRSLIEQLEADLELKPSAEAEATLFELQAKRQSVLETLGSRVRRAPGSQNLTQGSPSTDLSTTGCTQQHSEVADAYAGSSGPVANSSVSFWDDCGRWAEIFCYSHAHGDYGTTYNSETQASTSPQNVYGQGSCSVSSSVQADSDCFSRAYSQLRTNDDLGNPVTYFQEDINSICQPFDVSILGHTSITVPYGGCTTGNWYANSNRSGTSYSWTLSGSNLGTGSSKSYTFCSTYPSSAYISSENVRVTGTNGSDSDSAALFVDVFYQGGGISDPCGPYPELDANRAGADATDNAVPREPCY